MSTKRGDQPAHPVVDGEFRHVVAPGMTIREVFAKDAPAMPVGWFEAWCELQGFPATKYAAEGTAVRAGLWLNGVAAWRKASADALLAVLAEEPKP